MYTGNVENISRNCQILLSWSLCIAKTIGCCQDSKLLVKHIDQDKQGQRKAWRIPSPKNLTQ